MEYNQMAMAVANTKAMATGRIHRRRCRVGFHRFEVRGIVVVEGMMICNRNGSGRIIANSQQGQSPGESPSVYRRLVSPKSEMRLVGSVKLWILAVQTSCRVRK